MSDLVIKDKIYTIRGVQVMLDRDLAELYGVETRILNQVVKRNIKRFPKSFMFQLDKTELKNWKSQIVISNREIMGLRKIPYVFTEQGVSMLSGLLKSDIAIEVSIQIINTFVAMRKFISNNAQIFSRLENVEMKQITFEDKTNINFNKVFDALETHKPQQRIFFDGQIFDSHKFVSDLINSAKKEIILIDNYVDYNTLLLFSELKNVEVIVYTKKIN